MIPTTMRSSFTLRPLLIAFYADRISSCLFQANIFFLSLNKLRDQVTYIIQSSGVISTGEILCLPVVIGLAIRKSISIRSSADVRELLLKK